MAVSVRQLLAAIRHHRLDDHHEWVRTIRLLYELGELGDDTAEMHYYCILPLIEEAERRPNRLERPPTAEEIYAERWPPIVIGSLAENSEIPIGLFPEGAFHCLFAGTTGAGKTVAMRRTVMATEEASGS